jgi:transcriptional regulator with XRE-family HTH domain
LLGLCPYVTFGGMDLSVWMKRNPEWTDQKLADEVGVSRPYLTRIKLGERQPSLPVAARLAKVTKLPLTAFIKDAA